MATQVMQHLIKRTVERHQALVTENTEQLAEHDLQDVLDRLNAGQPVEASLIERLRLHLTMARVHLDELEREVIEVLETL